MTDNEIGERIDIMIRGELEARESWRKDAEGEIGVGLRGDRYARNNQEGEFPQFIQGPFK